MTAENRLRLAKHFLEQGKLDHPHVKEFWDQIKPKVEEKRTRKR